MKDLRCVHLDFHTSEKIMGIGADFDKEEFKAALIEAHLDSITLFAKGHHGCFYYESPKFFTHPGLAKPLLDLQVEACREAGVSSKIYISAGLDEHLAQEHPDWCRTDSKGASQNMLEAHWHPMCFSSEYTDVLVAQTIEVTERYMPDGLFFDIISEYPCYCHNCRRSMAKKGLDYENPAHVKQHSIELLHEWIGRVTEAAKSVKPDVMVFFNGGDFPVGRHDKMDCNNQLEAESLPTGGWGYDHFPLSMAYIRRQGKNCIGMTGKFHKTWGEFGGYKYKDALLYEGAQCLAFDAGLSVGDQLHPNGRVDRYTYENIGNAMRYIAAREPWRGGEFMAECAILSYNRHGGRDGAGRILFEGKYLFDLIETAEISNKYRFIILADEKRELTAEEYEALKGYVANGGKLIASGVSPLYEGKMAFDLGAEYVGLDKYSPSYIQAEYPLAYADGMALVIYEPFHEITLTGKKLADQVQPYFRRGDHGMFCSHNNTPCDYSKRTAAITEGRDGIYIAANIFTDYEVTGSLNAKQLILPLLAKLYGEKTVVSTTLPSSGKVVLYEKDGSFMLHMLYANTIKRGRDIEIIEDLVTLSDVSITLRLPRAVRTAVSHPEEKEIDLVHNADGTVTLTLDKLFCSAIVELK